MPRRALRHPSRARPAPLAEADFDLVLRFAFIPLRVLEPEEFGSIVPGGPAAALWSFVTYALLHADWAHLIFNRLWLAAFGAPWRGASAPPAFSSSRGRGRGRRGLPSRVTSRHGAAGRRLGGDLGADGRRQPLRLLGPGRFRPARPAPSASPRRRSLSSSATAGSSRSWGSGSASNPLRPVRMGAAFGAHRSPGKPISAASSPASCSSPCSIRSPALTGTAPASQFAAVQLVNAPDAPSWCRQGRGRPFRSAGRRRHFDERPDQPEVSHDRFHDSRQQGAGRHDDAPTATIGEASPNLPAQDRRAGRRRGPRPHRRHRLGARHRPRRGARRSDLSRRAGLLDHDARGR